MKEVHKGFIAIGSILAAIAVGLDAYGHHGLTLHVNTYAVEVYSVAVRYQMYHAFALIITGILYAYGNKKVLKIAGIAFIIGILLFSGRIYMVTIGRAIHSIALGRAAILSPLGGFAFIAGWLLLFVGAVKKCKD